MSNETYFTPEQAAQYLKSSTSTLSKLRIYGAGPRFCRIGRAVRYAKSDLDIFMSKRFASTTEQNNAKA